MQTSGTDSLDWRSLYSAAILESNPARVEARIAEAEQEIVRRARALFGAVGSGDETEALEDALYALRALKSCYRYGTAGSVAA